ncbi:MAG TPA: SsrA-binding protein, partial [Verrucomicrobiae bacterium]|nr:SsrA-binding protein [Verrucomicrobiae bacterium]
TGDEIKSIRANRVQLTGAYVRLMQGRGQLPKPVVIGVHLSLSKDPERTRALLLNAKELRMLVDEIGQKGKTAVPLDIHFRRGWAKLTIGIGKGRKRYDKRELLKTRDLDRQERAASKKQ